MPLLRHALWIAALMVPAAAGADAAPYVSWGKQDVPYEQYRADAVACGLQGAQRDMGEQQAFRDVVHGTHFQDSALDRGDVVEYVMIYDRKFRGNIPSLQKFLVSGVEECLINKGYTPFALTQDQTRRLSGLRKGSQERFHYLHEISSDVSILQAQRLEVVRR